MTIRLPSASPLRLEPVTAVDALDWRRVFGRDGRVEIEIGIGKGRFLLAVAAARPEVLHFGIEWSNEYLRIVETRAERGGLDNVRFIRADGRNREGVDVPYGFDGGVTGTVGSAGAVFVIELVRHSMKEEPPLINLIASHGFDITGAGEISTIAEITFYGRDQVGNEVSAVATVSVNFGDFGDP